MESSAGIQKHQESISSIETLQKYKRFEFCAELGQGIFRRDKSIGGAKAVAVCRQAVESYDDSVRSEEDREIGLVNEGTSRYEILRTSSHGVLGN